MIRIALILYFPVLFIPSPWLKKKFDVLKCSRMPQYACHIHTFTIVDNNFEIWRSEMLRIASILYFPGCYIHTFAMVDKNFEIWCSEMLQIASILYFAVIFIPSPWLNKIPKLSFYNSLRYLNSILKCHIHTFPMVEENYEIWRSKILQDAWILYFPVIFILSL